MSDITLASGIRSNLLALQTTSNDLTSTVPLRFGAAADATADQFYQGIEDEVRISNVARSIDWIMTDYNLQKAGSTFVTLGVEKAP